MTTLIISNEEMNDIMKKIKSIKGAGLLIKAVGETIQNEAKERKGSLLGMLLRTLDTSKSIKGNLLLGNLFKVKE